MSVFSRREETLCFSLVVHLPLCLLPCAPGGVALPAGLPVPFGARLAPGLIGDRGIGAVLALARFLGDLLLRPSVLPFEFLPLRLLVSSPFIFPAFFGHLCAFGFGAFLACGNAGDRVGLSRVCGLRFSGFREKLPTFPISVVICSRGSFWFFDAPYRELEGVLESNSFRRECGLAMTELLIYGVF